MAVFVGIDLAWVPGRQSGWCVLEGDRRGAAVLESGVRAEDPMGMAHAVAGLGASVVAVDAPLLLGFDREAERMLGRWFGAYRAGAFLATRQFLDLSGSWAGPALGEALTGLGVTLDPLKAIGVQPVALEVYPHALHVTWLRLAERVLYKRKRGRRVRDVRAGLDELRAGLGAFALVQRVDLTGAQGMAVDVRSLKGRALKAQEDELDGISCALAAYLVWRDGLLPGEVFGSYPAGYIAVPGLRDDPDFAERFTSGPVPSFPSAQALGRARSWRQGQGEVEHGRAPRYP